CCSSARSVWYCFQSPRGRLVPSVATRTTLAPAVCQASAVVSVSCGGVVLKVRAPRWGGARPSVCVDVDGRACGRTGRRSEVSGDGLGEVHDEAVALVGRGGGV